MLDQLPQPPACPDWCETPQKGWQLSSIGAEQRCQRETSCGHDLDGGAVSVEVVRFAFAEHGTVEVCDPEIGVRCVGRIDDVTATRLSGSLVEAVRLVTQRVAGVA